MTTWTEVADGVLQRRYQPLDVSVCVVRGDHGLLVVDTRSCPREADEIRRDLEVLGAPVRWVVNTHAHFDHTFGNQRFGPGSDVGVPIYGHRLVPAHLDDYERPRLAAWIAEGREPVDDWASVEIVAPTELVDTSLVLDLGSRKVELVHLGRGHTDNDLLLHVPDADAWLAGDLIEESGPPMYGSGCFPLEWPATVAALAARLTDAAVVVPGHGTPVALGFVVAQQEWLARVADAISELYEAQVPADAAASDELVRSMLPQHCADGAVRAAYRQLGAAAARAARPIRGE